jgi:hypothetical protein
MLYVGVDAHRSTSQITVMTCSSDFATLPALRLSCSTSLGYGRTPNSLEQIEGMGLKRKLKIVSAWSDQLVISAAVALLVTWPP